MTSTTIGQRSRSAARTALLEIDGVMVVLFLLMSAGVFAGVWRLFTGLGASTNLNNGYAWGLWIGLDFTMIAFSGAGFTMAFVGHVLGLKRFHAAMRVGVLTGLLGYVGVLVLLVLDLGRWDRFYSFIINWNIHSPLFEICFCVLLYSMVLVFENLPQVLAGIGKHKLAHAMHKAIMPIVIIGVTLSSLHQSTLGTLYLAMPHRLHPFWYTPLLPLQFFTSSIMVGLSVALLMYVLASKIRSAAVDKKVVNGLALGAAWSGVVYLVLKIGDVIASGELAAIMANTPMANLWKAEVLLGVILPIVLLLVPQLRRNRRIVLLGAGLFAAGVLFNRINSTLFAQMAPSGYSYTASSLEWVSSIGVLSGVALAWYLAVKYLPILQEKHGH